MAFNCRVLNVNKNVEHRDNADWLGINTLGIEVTDALFVPHCGLGNLDPQHTPPFRETAAIKEALVWPLPPDGANLVTVRPDKDSVGAAAVLCIRADGEESQIDHELIEWVALVDVHGYKRARVSDPYLFKRFGTKKLLVSMDTLVHDQSDLWTLADKVSLVADMLVQKMPTSMMDEIISLRERNDYVHVDFNNCVEKYDAGPKCVAFVEAPGRYRQARSWGGARFPVTIVHDGSVKRFSLIRQPGHFDRLGFEQEINELEAEARGLVLKQVIEQGLAWGGNSNIISSQSATDRQTQLQKHVVIQVAHAHLESGIVT